MLSPTPARSARPRASSGRLARLRDLWAPPAPRFSSRGGEMLRCCVIVYSPLFTFHGMRFPAGLGLGLGTALQLVPFHCSITVVVIPLMSVTEPTAQMSLAETAATPASRPAEGLETAAQLVPFHCSVRVCAPFPVSPTAHTSLAETAVIGRARVGKEC